MRITLVCPLVTGVQSQIASCFAQALRNYEDVQIVAPAHYAVEDDLRKDVTFLNSPKNRYMRAAYWVNPLSVSGFKRALRSTQPDVVHLFNGQGYLPSLLLPCLSAGRPVVVTVHDPVAHSGAYADHVLYSAARHLLLPKVQKIHAMSHYAAEQLQQQGIPRGRLVVTRHGAITSLFFRHNRTDVVRGNSLLFFGRWEHYKGIDLLVEAIESLAKSGLRQHCILAGPGSVNAKTRQTIARNPDLFEVHNRYLDDAKVATLFQRANRLVLPYRDATQSSLPALAQAYRMLLISTAVGALTEETVSQGGVVVKPNSAAALAEGIRCSVGREPQATAFIDYSWDTVASQMSAAYRNLA